MRNVGRTRVGARLRRVRLKGSVVSATVVAGIGITIATFSFQTTQVWIDEGTHSGTLRWLFPTTVAALVALLTTSMYLLFWIPKPHGGPAPADPYQLYADGVLAYGRKLHEEQRDPALLRLRENTSLTLHVLGFHEARATLGTWALESAQFVDDKLAVVSIRIDDTGWANYLLGKSIATTNIEKAIRYAGQLPPGFGEPQRSLLVAKAHRHLGVIKTATAGSLQRHEFQNSIDILNGVQNTAPHKFRVELAHVSYARALAIASMLKVNVSGKIRLADTEGTELLGEALEQVRTARDGFRAEADQGRYAKSLVLEVRLLEALHESNEAEQLLPLRDRAVAASVWSRPAGAAFITGR